MEHFTPSEAPIHETRRLPVIPPAKIVGRNAELGQTFAQVRTGRAVLLYGPSGIGKSALAATIASAFTAFSGGVLWWQVEGDSPEHLIARLGRAYGDTGISDGPAPMSQVGAAQRLLQRENKPLIVLDGVLDFDAVRVFVSEVAPGVPVILANESSESGPWTSVSLSYLKDADAVALFMSAAGLDQISSVVRVDIQGICNILRGSPLAITLAGRAVRVTGLMPGEFLGTLTTPGRSGPLLGLNSVFQGLPDALHSLLFHLGATFAGRATTALMELLSSAPADTLAQALNMLAARGLASPFPCADATCYRMHEMVQSFASSWLHGAQRLEATVERVLEALVAYAERNAADTREARDQLVAEMPNLLGAAQHASRRGDALALRRLEAALRAAFGPVGGYGYELRMLQGMLEKLTAQFASPEATLAELAQMAMFPTDEPPVSTLPPAPPPAPAAPPIPAAGTSYDTRPMQPVEGQARGLAPERIAPEVVAADRSPAVVEPLPEDLDIPLFPEAAPVEEEQFADEVLPQEETTPAEEEEEADEIEALLDAIDTARASGNSRQAAASLNALGQLLIRQERADEAHEAFTEALAAAEDASDEDQTLVALESLSSLSLNEGDLESAVHYATRAENFVARQGDPARWGYLLALLGDIRLELDEIADAIRTYQQAVDKLSLAGEALSVGIVQTKVGGIYLDQGQPEQAIAVLSEANGVFERERRADYQERALGYLGSAYGQLTRWPEAEQYHAQALVLARSMGDVEEQERQLENLAYIAQARGDREMMLARYRQGLALAYRIGAVVWQVRFLDVLGRLLMDDLPRVGLAARMLEEAESLVPDEERARLLARARKRLERAQASGTPLEPAPQNVSAWAALE